MVVGVLLGDIWWVTLLSSGTRGCCSRQSESYREQAKQFPILEFCRHVKEKDSVFTRTVCVGRTKNLAPMKQIAFGTRRIA